MQVAAQARGPAAQAGNTNSLAYGMDNVQPAPRSNASIPQAYAGTSSDKSLNAQHVETCKLYEQLHHTLNRQYFYVRGLALFGVCTILYASGSSHPQADMYR